MKIVGPRLPGEMTAPNRMQTTVPSPPLPMKTFLLLSVLSLLAAVTAPGQTSNPSSNGDKKTMAEIRRVMDYELKLVLTEDTAAMRQFYPDDMAVTNPFNQFIDKRKVMKRVKADIIKYASYEIRVFN
jgi:hypothetical protein